VNTKGRWASAAKASQEHPAGVGGVDLPHSTKKGEAPEEESEEVTPPKPATAVVERESVDRSNKNPALQPLAEEGSEEGSQEENPPERTAVVVVVAVSDKTKKNRALESPSTAARGKASGKGSAEAQSGKKIFGGGWRCRHPQGSCGTRFRRTV